MKFGFIVKYSTAVVHTKMKVSDIKNQIRTKIINMMNNYIKTERLYSLPNN